MKNKAFFVGVCILGMLLLATLVAAEDIYDSGAECFSRGINPLNGLSFYVTDLNGNAHFTPSQLDKCGILGSYSLKNGLRKGAITMQTHSLPEEGEYNFEFQYRVLDFGILATEKFSVECGGEEFPFTEITHSNILKEKTIRCNFEEGRNEVKFKSLGGDTIRLLKFQITGEENGDSQEEIVDEDEDDVEDSEDNCPIAYNPEQEDENGNGLGDVCEMFDEGSSDDTIDNEISEDDDDEYEEIVIPVWNCSSWKNSGNGYETRKCSLVSGPNRNKPAEIRTYEIAKEISAEKPKSSLIYWTIGLIFGILILMIILILVLMWR